MRIAFFLAATLGAYAAGSSDSITQRVDTRDFPSIFQAWNSATRLPGQSDEQMIARHDLFFCSAGQLGLRWQGEREGDATELTPESIQAAAQKVARLRRLNPHLLILVEVRYRDAPGGFFADDSPSWMRDAAGHRIVGWAEGGFFKIDFSRPDVQALVAQKAQALAATGFIDGVMLDWWSDDPARLALIRAVRAGVGGKLILVNGNDREFPLTASYVNGTYMECTQNSTPNDWARIAATLRWAEKATRAPRIDCLETWWHQSRKDLDLMRVTTTLGLTESDGYCLFADPDPLPTPDHLHDWYPFWEKGLGLPLAPGKRQFDGSWRRAFTHGEAVYNPLGNEVVTVQFDRPFLSRATGQLVTKRRIASGDGDIFTRQE